MPKKGHTRPPRALGDLSDPEGLGRRAEEFLEALGIRNYSERTITVRRSNLAIFINWCAQRSLKRPLDITKPVLERYQRTLYHFRKKNGEPLTVQCQHTRLVTVRMFFKWLTKQNYLLHNPASELELPRLEQRLPKYVLTEREAEQVLTQCNVREPLGIRDRAILETFYSTGMRRMELVELNIFSVDLDRGTVTIRQGKGKKDRVIPIGQRAIVWIRKYLDEVRPKLVVPPDDRRLFVTRLGKGFAPGRMSILVREYVQDAGIGKQGACHLFRHTMATLMLENGADVRFIQAMLGHVSLETTQIYTRVSIRKLKEIHTATHPAKNERTVSLAASPPQEHDLSEG